MKTIDQVTACVCDYGSFIGLAEAMAKKCKRALYVNPSEQQEFRDIKDSCIGDGLENVELVADPFSPEIIREVDLFCFPDLWTGGVQRYLREQGKAVWGSMGASELELYRTRFLKTLKQVGLEVPPYTTIKGLTNLRAYLMENENCWVKVNKYRANMETFHHIDYAHSQAELCRLECEFGGLCEQVVFVVQAPIEGVQEIGYDGLSVDGQFPKESFQGYEAKNEAYLGSLLSYARLPEPVRVVNEAFSPVLREYGYRNFFATEIRGDYFTDPTMRQAGQTMEHQYRTCTNLPEVIWSGANGDLVEPEFSAKFAAEATLHYKGCDGWKVLRVEPEAREHCTFYHYAECDGALHFPPAKTDEVGVVCGDGDSVEDAIEDLKRNFELLEGEPVEICLDKFAELIEQIQAAEKEGMKFGGELPEKEIALP